MSRSRTIGWVLLIAAVGIAGYFGWQRYGGEHAAQVAAQKRAAPVGPAVPVKIAPGKSENLPAEMAAHFFGWHPDAKRAEMLKHTAKRHGWNTAEFVAIDPATRKTKADTYFDALKIEPKAYKLVPAEDADPRAPVPADPQLPPSEQPQTEMVKGPFGRMVPKRVEVQA